METNKDEVADVGGLTTFMPVGDEGAASGASMVVQFNSSGDWLMKRDVQALLATKAAPDPYLSAPVACAEDGKLRWITGRKFDNCELYIAPQVATKAASVEPVTDERCPNCGLGCKPSACIYTAELSEAAPSAPEQAEPEAVREFLQGLVDCKGGMVSGNQLSRRAEELLASVPPVPASAEQGDKVDQITMLKREIHNLKRHIEDYCQPAAAPQPSTPMPHVGGNTSAEASEIIVAFMQAHGCGDTFNDYIRRRMMSDFAIELAGCLAHVARQDQAAPVAWYVCKEHVIGRELFYALPHDAKPFTSFEDAAADIKAKALPLGWIATQFAAQAAPADRLDEALATFLAEHTRLNEDGIDTYSMKLSLALNHVALNPVPEAEFAEWRAQGYLVEPSNHG